jgi:diadenosine tetraphosphate (Ap4A) HIT family hydrolase
MEICEWCTLEKEWLLLETSKWEVHLADEQDYVGRCIFVLKRHCGSLVELTNPEWIELKNIIDRVEFIYKDVLGAKLCNWSCLMNNFYKETNPNPHLHIHMRPRFENGFVINNHIYTDGEFSRHYALKKESEISVEDKKTLYGILKIHFTQKETGTII